jgi:hypothetical protein
MMQPAESLNGSLRNAALLENVASGSCDGWIAFGGGGRRLRGQAWAGVAGSASVGHRKQGHLRHD